MAKKLRSAIIVGGGTAGWMAGLALGRRLLREENSKVYVVEADVLPIGVGEATVPHLRFTLDALGVGEDEFMRRTGATFKLGMKFVNWSDQSPADVYWSPFSPDPAFTAFAGSITDYLSKLDELSDGNCAQREHFDYAGSGFVNAWLSERARAPKFGTEAPYRGQVTYAYHLDAIRLAELLREKAIATGVVHLRDTVVDTVIDGGGFIRCLRTQTGMELSAELFIDCTGFRGVLIRQALKEPFISYASNLLCDRALAMPIPPGSTTRTNPYTTATAASHGWIFETPLFHRRGTGYIYASAFSSDDQAEQELRGHIGVAADTCPSPRRISWQVGRTRRAWVGNCISLGLASGFIDPLHAPSILLIERGLLFLDMYFPDSDFAPALARTYNSRIAEAFDRALDFIFLHYFASPRRDTPFWCAATEAPAPDGAGEILELWDRLTFEVGDLAAPISHLTDTFGGYGVPCMLLGVGRLPKRALDAVRNGARMTPGSQNAAAVMNPQNRFAALPDHATYLTQLNDGSLERFRELISKRVER